MKSTDYANAAHRGEAMANREKETLPSGPVCSASRDETIRRGLRILARIVVREYLRRTEGRSAGQFGRRPCTQPPQVEEQGT